jgi:hypothetical protein
VKDKVSQLLEFLEYELCPREGEGEGEREREREGERERERERALKR